MLHPSRPERQFGFRIWVSFWSPIAVYIQLKEETCFVTKDLLGLLRPLRDLPGGRRAVHFGGPLLVEREMPDYSLTVRLILRIPHNSTTCWCVCAVVCSLQE